MSDQTLFRFCEASAQAVPVIPVRKAGLEGWRSSAAPDLAAQAATRGFRAAFGEACLLTHPDGTLACVLAGMGDAQDAARKRFAMGAVAAAVPAGTYKLDTDVSDFNTRELREAALGWLLAGYRFTTYAGTPPQPARLVAPEGLDAQNIEVMAEAEALTRDLINTPANDMGPEQIERAAHTLADRFGAQFLTIIGDDLLDANFPLIHMVGRASPRAPRLIELTAGETGPQITLVGKGVAFDTGGLNLKPGASMGLMKKDMGGAANVLGAALMILALKLPVRLRVLIPAVENSVAGNAFRPGDIVTARNGKTVEINNTDAEGRLILADALALAAEGKPDLIISMATLTGAARVAAGPDLAPFFTDDEGMASALSVGAADWADPVWRMPFHDPYEEMIEPGVADLDNAPAGGMAGAITAALFLRRFTEGLPYVHFDIYGWNPKSAPARAKGGAMQGVRALLSALSSRVGG